MRQGHSSAEMLVLITALLLGLVFCLTLNVEGFEAVIRQIAVYVQVRWFPV